MYRRLFTPRKLAFVGASHDAFLGAAPVIDCNPSFRAGLLHLVDHPGEVRLRTAINNVSQNPDFLRSEGFDVVLTQTAQAVKAVREFQPDVVPLDIGMPERSGYVLASQLTREHGVRHHVNQPYESDALLKLLASLRPKG